MRKYVQVLNQKAHWIFESEEKPEFAPNIILIDITDLDPQPEEGWDYDERTGEFTPPIEEEPPEDQPTLDERVEQLQIDNTILLMALTDLYAEIQTLKGDD